MFDSEKICSEYLSRVKKTRIIEAVMTYVLLMLSVLFTKYIVSYLNSVSEDISLVLWFIYSVAIFLSLYYIVIYLFPRLSVKLTKLDMDKEYGLVNCSGYWVTDEWNLESAKTKQNNYNYFLNLNSHYIRINKDIYDNLSEKNNKKSLLIIEQDNYENLRKSELKA